MIRVCVKWISSDLNPQTSEEDPNCHKWLPLQMWRGVKSTEEIAAMAKAAHGRVVLEAKVKK